MATVGRSDSMHPMERWSWRKDLPSERVSSNEGGKLRIAIKRSATPIWGTILEQAFEELILTI